MASRPVVQVRSLEGESTSTLPLRKSLNPNPETLLASHRGSWADPPITQQQPLSSRPPSVTTSSPPFTSRWPRTSASLTPSPRTLVTRPLPSPGELDVPLLVSPVLEEEEPTAPDRCVAFLSSYIGRLEPGSRRDVGTCSPKGQKADLVHHYS